MNCCPHCGRAYPPKLPVGGAIRQRLVDIVARRPDGITRDELFDLVYAGHPNGGPTNMNIISVMIKTANERLRPQGYRIISTMGPGAKYSLVRPYANSVNEPSGHSDARTVAGTESAITSGQH